MADKKQKLGFGRQISRASAMQPISRWAFIAGVVFGVVWIVKSANR